MHPMLPFFLAALDTAMGGGAALVERRQRLGMTIGIAGSPSRPWLGPPPHSHRIKAKRRARRAGR